MFMGHYGAAVWDTQRGTGDVLIPLWVGFLAVQFIDIVFAFMVMFGLEGGSRMVAGVPLFTIPYSHSLVTALGWSAVGTGIFKLFRPEVGSKALRVIFALIFSHWILDFIVHRPDLPLWPGSPIQLGLGGWNWPILAFVLEVGFLAAAFIYWMRVTTGPRVSAIGLSALFFVMSALQYAFVFIPGRQVQNGTFDPTSGLQGASMGLSILVVYVLLTLAIASIEAHRSPVV